MMHPHLNSEQMERLLHDPNARAASLHLQVCPQCVEELQQLEAVFGELRNFTASVATSERARAVVPITRSHIYAGWKTYVAAASMALACATVPVAWHRQKADAMQARQPKPAPAQTISDEALLNSIQSDLSASVPAAMKPLAASSSPQSSNDSRKD